MKVEMAIVKAAYRETRALEPAMFGKPFMVDEAYAWRIEAVSRGRIRRMPTPEPGPERRRGRPKKTVEE